LVEKIGGAPIPNYRLFLELEVSGELDGDDAIDCLLPTIKYAYKG